MILTEPSQDLLKPLILEWEFNTLGKRLFGPSFKTGHGFKPEKPPKKQQDQVELDFSGNQASPEEADEVSSADAHFKTISDVQHEYTLHSKQNLIWII